MASYQLIFPEYLDGYEHETESKGYLVDVKVVIGGWYVPWRMGRKRMPLALGWPAETCSKSPRSPASKPVTAAFEGVRARCTARIEDRQQHSVSRC